MFDEIFTGLVTIGILLAVAALKPDRARCPSGWYLNEGVRRSGHYHCVPSLVGGEQDPAGGIDRSVQPYGALGGRIYCTGNSRPIIVDYKTVGCQPRGWR